MTNIIDQHHRLPLSVFYLFVHMWEWFTWPLKHYLSNKCIVNTMVVDAMPTTLSIWPKVADVDLQHGSQSQQDRLQSAAFHWPHSSSLLRIPWVIWLTLIMISSFTRAWYQFMGQLSIHGSASASIPTMELNHEVVANLRPNTVEVQTWFTCNRVNADRIPHWN